ncbi:hypothetical protein N9X61_03195, partial [Sulfurimonas sp.]|nr:hypothetical protein [Sulfurimonas sp.]
MELNGLSIDQAPPISAPLRFFLTAPLFAILAGFLILLTESESLISRFTMDSIVITHIITIGFLGFIMLGAMTQMLPVLAGAKIPKVNVIATLSHALLVLGSLSMFIGLYQGISFYNVVAFIGLGSGFFLILGAIILSLKDVMNFNATVKGISVSVFFAFTIVVMGLYLLSSYITNDISSTHNMIAD